MASIVGLESTRTTQVLDSIGDKPNQPVLLEKVWPSEASF